MADLRVMLAYVLLALAVHWDALRPWLATVTVRVARRMLRLRHLMGDGDA